MKSLNIAILGATSHIAKGLINNFCNSQFRYLYLYSRSPENVKRFLTTLDTAKTDTCKVNKGFRDFHKYDYDVIINCIGAGPPKVLKNNYSSWFMLTEKFDNLVIKYLTKKADTLYINFSSGAVYGNNHGEVITEESATIFQVNKLKTANYYAIANINSEAKHRSFKNFNIVDLRIFSYFSRYINLESGYFITELIGCLLRSEPLITNSINIIRDFVSPADLFSLIQKCIDAGQLNMAYDVYSICPVEKFQIIEFFVNKYELTYEVNSFSSHQINSPNDTGTSYYSANHNALSLGYTPHCSSLDTIEQESQFILG